MPDVDAIAVLLGFGVGMAASGLFFAGLSLGLRWALKMRYPVLVLVPSFLLRAAMLLGAGWWLVRVASPSWSLPAFMLAFFVVRATVLHWARRGGAGVAQRQEAG